MTLDSPHTAPHNRRVMFGDAIRGGASGVPQSAGASLQAREPAPRPETASERKARFTSYLGTWPQVMAEHARLIREREGR